MMRFVLALVIIAILAFLAGVYFPWWTIALVAALVAALIPQRPLYSFLSGFVAVAGLWILLASLINASNTGILAGRIGRLMGVGNHPVVMVLLSGFVGGLVAGLAALSVALFLKRTKAES
jgi:hypothetical protein